MATTTQPRLCDRCPVIKADLIREAYEWSNISEQHLCRECYIVIHNLPAEGAAADAMSASNTMPSDVENVPVLVERPLQQTSTPSTYVSQDSTCCIPTCQYGRKRDRRRNMISCAWCNEQFHTTCCLADREAPVVFTCPSCRAMPNQVYELTTTMQATQRYLPQLVKTNHELTVMVNTKDSHIDNLNDENRALRENVSRIAQENQRLTWEMNRIKSKNQKKKLLVGSSIIRDIDPVKVNVDLRSISGAKVKDVLDNVKGQQDHVDEIMLVVGGNDCNEASRDAGDVQDILETYAALIAAAKEKSEAITVSSICLRLTSPETQESIEPLNAGLQELVDNNGWKFVDNRATFILHDGTINDGYLLSDGVHLNRQGTNRLAKNLCLVSKDNTNDITKTSRKPPSHPPQPPANTKQPAAQPQASSPTTPPCCRGCHLQGAATLGWPPVPLVRPATWWSPHRRIRLLLLWRDKPQSGHMPMGQSGYMFLLPAEGTQGKWCPQSAQHPPIA